MEMIRIKELRFEKKLSQSALAKKIFCSQKAIDYWEKGQAQPSLHYLIAIADFFECSIDYLCGRSDDFGNITTNANLDNNEQTILSYYRNCGSEAKKEVTEFAKFKSFNQHI